MCFVSPDEEEEEEDPEDERRPAPRVYIGEAPSVTIIPKLVPQPLQEEEEMEEGVSDSDSEGPILYKDEEEDEEEDESLKSKVFALQPLLSSCTHMHAHNCTWPCHGPVTELVGAAS